MITIENDHLRVRINAVGAELSELYNKATGLDYMWNADPQYWSKKSPVLFPIVGTLKDNSYFFEDKSYHLNRHGFAREKTFTVKEQNKDAVAFELVSDESTLALYPFHFNFTVHYTIQENQLSISYQVANGGEETMFFSVGGHPAFKVPMVDGIAYDDYFLQFNKKENAGRWPIDKNGLIETSTVPLFNDTDRLSLSKSLFYQDAIVLKHLASDEVQLLSDKSTAGLRFSFKGFPYLGIWAAKDASFVCIEPWCGIADSVDTNQHLSTKEGIVALDAGQQFTRTWEVTTF